MCISGLSDRVADIPSIFRHLVLEASKRYGLDGMDLVRLLSTDHYEALCLADFAETNVRGLADLADRLSVKLKTWGDPDKVIREVFLESFEDSKVARRPGRRFKTTASVYEPTASGSRKTRREDPGEGVEKPDKLGLVLAAYRKTGGNVTGIERALRESEVHCSRRWIADVLDKHGLPRIKRK